ncbi:MAG: hemolysin family protein [Rhizobium sp.]|nr:hemolysin family protein [Rhizobium sp.]
MFTEIAIVLFLTVLNGVLAMSELAVVSARPARLKVLAEQGSLGAETALRLASDPGRFLSTVQIGITLVGVLSGAFSGATLGARLSSWLQLQGFSVAASDALGVGTVVVLITYLSLIVGELVPKQVALRNAEGVASRVAIPMSVLSRVAAPLVWLLNGSGKLVLALLGQSGDGGGKVTDEEIRTVLAEAHSAGVIESSESAMLSGVMRLADRQARGLMTPRRDVQILDIEDKVQEVREKLRDIPHSRIPVRSGDSDEIAGVLLTKKLYEQIAEGGALNLADLISEVPVVSDLAKATDIIESLRRTSLHMVLVYDEYGHFEGIITSGDILEAITGAFSQDETEEQAMVRRDDGSYLVAGWTPVDEFIDVIRIPIDPDPDYTTIAGFVLDELKRIPELGESFVKGDWRFEVIDLDGRRIDKLLVSRVAAGEA